jgi:septal ring factor EnvC (AmiA/AmiB activator)
MRLSIKPSAVFLKTFGLLCVFSLLFSRAVYSQDFSSIDQDLLKLEDLINDTIANTQEQQKLLEDLKKSLSESGNLIESYERIIDERENSLRDLQARLNEMSETYRKQSALSTKYERSSKFWRTFTLIAIPAAAVISGAAVFVIVK